VCIYMYILIYVHIYICVHLCTIYLCILRYNIIKYVCIYIFQNMYIYINMYVYVYIYTYAIENKCVRVRVRSKTHTRQVARDTKLHWFQLLFELL